jgi:hypothetical protein
VSIFFAAEGFEGGAQAHATALATTLVCNLSLLVLTIALAFRLPRLITSEATPVSIGEA